MSPPPKSIRLGILFAALSLLGGAISANEALRHLRRAAEGAATLLSIKAALALLSAAFAAAFILLCVRYLRDSARHKPLQTACVAGIGVELLYQGFELYFYAAALSSSNNPLAAALYAQLALFLCWMLGKLAIYAAIRRDLSQHTP